MARKKRAIENKRLRPAGAFPGRMPLVEHWLEKIRRHLPEESSLVATIHRMPRNLNLISFRATASGETFVSEARERSVEWGIRVAGMRLLEHLVQSPLPKPRLRQRIRRFFRDAG